MSGGEVASWVVPRWATSGELADDGVVYSRVVPVGGVPLLAVMARQCDALVFQGERVQLRRGPLEVVIEGLVLPRPGAVRLAEALGEVLQATVGAP